MPTPRRRRRVRPQAQARRAGAAFARLVRVMATLRSPRGCPWDRRQTHQSLRPFLVEETYEALDAIDRRDLAALPEELGDVVFQCVFHAQIAAEAGRFEIADSLDAIVAKLIRRHPHVFTAAGRPLSRAAHARRRARTAGAVLEQWEVIKARERKGAGTRPRVLAGVPRTMPALLRAHEIGTRVAAVGFDWARATDVMAKVEEEVAELRAALARRRSRPNDRREQARVTEEFGDVLFTLASMARHLGLEPESALRQANDKFTRRFDAVEARFARQKRSVHEASVQEMERAWEKVKRGRV